MEGSATGSMARQVLIGDRPVGGRSPVYVVAEIGINHNGDLDLAKRLIDVAAVAGCDAVKFQKRTPELCVPPDQRDALRDTPWGRMTYMDYRERVEFDRAAYTEIDRHCRDRGIQWTASCWDHEALAFLETFNPPFHKVPSACLTHHDLLRRMRETGRPVVLSTGMSTMEEIRRAVSALDTDRLVLCHATSTYPSSPDELNLRMISTLQSMFDCPVGYSGHEVGLQTSFAAVALGAALIERHVTLDRHMWGSDQHASIEPTGLLRLVRDIRVIERSLGDGIKRVYPSELPVMRRLRQPEWGDGAAAQGFSTKATE